MAKRELYERETNWGVHTVTEGFGKHTGKFIAESRGWGGKAGYFKVCETEQEARDYVDSQTRPLAPLPPEEQIRF